MAPSRSTRRLSLVLEPTLREAHFNLGRSAQTLADDLRTYPEATARSRDLEEALEHFHASVTAEDPAGLKNAEEVLYQLGRRAEAEAAFAAYVKLRPKAAVHKRDALRCTDGSLQAYLTRVVGLSGGEMAPMDPVLVEALCELSLLKDGEDGEEGWEGWDENIGELRPEYVSVAAEYNATAVAKFPCPGVLAPPWSYHLGMYFATWHRLGLSYRELDPQSEDFLARGRWALDNEGLALFVADALAPSVSRLAGKPMKASFAKVAVMDETAYLPPHRDEAACDVSITVTLAAGRQGSGGGSGPPLAWPIWLQRPPDTNGPVPVAHAIETAVGDCVSALPWSRLPPLAGLL